jgi:molecular chaperone DnaK
MVREAEQHAAEDKRRREVIEARNQADALIYGTEKNLQEHGSNLNDADRRAIEEAIAALRTAIADDDAAVIRQHSEALSRAATRLGEAVYGGGRSSGDAPGGGPSASSGDGGVVDAEFEEVDKTDRRAS